MCILYNFTSLQPLQLVEGCVLPFGGSTSTFGPQPSTKAVGLEPVRNLGAACVDASDLGPGWTFAEFLLIDGQSVRDWVVRNRGLKHWFIVLVNHHAMQGVPPSNLKYLKWG